MMDWQFAAVIAGFIVSVTVIVSFLCKSFGNLAAKYKAPFEKLHGRVDELERHKPKCEERFEELESVKSVAETVANHDKYLSNDKDSIKAMRRDLNNQADDIYNLYEIVGDLAEGVHLVMQHEVKGNHIVLLEEWMRKNASGNIKRKERK